MAEFSAGGRKAGGNGRRQRILGRERTPHRRIRHYEHNGNSITIAPGAYGLATIWDKDILIYLISQIVEGLNQGREDAKSRKVRFRVYDYLVSTNRPVGGEHYKRLESVLDPLKGTSLQNKNPPRSPSITQTTRT